MVVKRGKTETHTESRSSFPLVHSDCYMKSCGVESRRHDGEPATSRQSRDTTQYNRPDGSTCLVTEQYLWLLLHHVGFLLDLLFDPEQRYIARRHTS
jgi:hypothetical protein